jgi:hypothetical protein
MDRLDIAQAAIWGDIINGATPEDRARGVQALVRIMERRAKLLGLDMPTKAQIEVTNYDTATIDSEVARLVALLDSKPPRAMEPSVGENGTITD